MSNHTTSRIFLLVLVISLSVGCAGFMTNTQRSGPYRSATLNANFVSAYPRATSANPLGITSGTPDSSQYAESHVNDGDLAAVSIPSEGSIVDSIYNPIAAAAYVTVLYQANETATTGDSSESPSIVDIYRYTQHAGTIYHAAQPAVGDLVFFHNTFDRNGDGRNNDWYTHIGVVESVDNDGDIFVLSYLDGQVSRTHLNLESPNESTDENGNVLNTVMRRRSENDAPYTQYLASELCAGFGSLLGERTEFLVIDNWQPGMNVAALE